MLELYTVYDQKAKSYHPPTPVINRQTFIHLIMGLLNTEEGKTINPAEWDIIKIADFDQSTGKVIPLEMPVHVCNLSMLSTNQEQVEELAKAKEKTERNNKIKSIEGNK